MVKVTNIKGTKCEKIVSTRGDSIYIQPKNEKRTFYEQVYVSLGKSKKGWSLQRIGGKKGFDNNPKGAYWRYKNNEIGHLPKEKAIKEAIKWMKKQKQC